MPSYLVIPHYRFNLRDGNMIRQIATKSSVWLTQGGLLKNHALLPSVLDETEWSPSSSGLFNLRERAPVPIRSKGLGTWGVTDKAIPVTGRGGP
jgi:hypothetical protein